MVPEILYKFIDDPGATAFLSAPQLRYKDWRKLDDIMEVMPGFVPMGLEEARLDAKIRDEYLTKFAPEWREFALQNLCSTSPFSLERSMRERFNRSPPDLFICSLTSRWNSGPMWGHYAEQHKGMVIGFRLERLRQLEKGREKYLSEVSYELDRPVLHYPKLDLDILRKAVVTKSSDWEYQAEWRIVSGSDRIDFFRPDDVPELILGYESSDYLRNLAQAFSKHGTKVFHAYPDPLKHEVTRLVATDAKRAF